MKVNFGVIFLLFLLIFLTTNGGHTDAWDGKAYFLLTENIIENKSLMLHNDLKGVSALKFDIDQYFLVQSIWQNNGEMVDEIPSLSMFIAAAPLLSIIGIPFYFIGTLTGIPETQSVPYFVNSIILALTSATVFVFSEKYFSSKKIAFLLAIIFSVCSFSWAYADTFFQQPLLGLSLILSVYFIYMAYKTTKPRFILLGGIFSAIVLVAHPTGIIFLPGIFAYIAIVLRNNLTRIRYYAVGFLPIVFLQGYLNFFRFGSFSDFGYGAIQGMSEHMLVEGIYGLIFSPGFGLIINFPMFVLFPLSIYLLSKKDKTMSFLFIYIFVVSWIFFGTIYHWHGFGGWGPRYLLPIVPIMVVSIGMIIKKLGESNFIQSLFVSLASIGFFVNLLGTMVWYQLGYTYGWTEFNKLGITSPQEQLDHFQWNLQFIPIVLHWNVLTTGFYDGLLPENIPAYWEACIPDIFLFCNFGLVVIIPMLILISVLSIVIIKNLQKSSLSNFNK